MSLYINQTTTTEVPPGTPLASCSPDGTLAIWPGGVGFGPVFQLPIEEWMQIRNSVDAAIRAVGFHDGR